MSAMMRSTIAPSWSPAAAAAVRPGTWAAVSAAAAINWLRRDAIFLLWFGVCARTAREKLSVREMSAISVVNVECKGLETQKNGHDFVLFLVSLAVREHFEVVPFPEAVAVAYNIEN